MNRFKVRDQKSRSLVYKYVDAIMCCVDAHLFYILEPTGNTEKGKGSTCLKVVSSSA